LSFRASETEASARQASGGIDGFIMSHFCLLRDPDQYVGHDWDLAEDASSRQYWLDLFSRHFEETLGHAAHRYGRSAGKKIDAARKEFSSVISKLRQAPVSLPGGKLNVLELCRARERVLRAHGLFDPFGHVKDRENAAAVRLYPEILSRLRAGREQTRWLHRIEGVFAGNVFDLGSPATMHLADQSSDFLATLDALKPRPWLVDDFDRLNQDLPHSPPPKWSRAVVFVDNAGGDFILGLMPLARQLALGGTQIVLAANELPSLNDLTAEETGQIVERLAAADADLAALIGGGMFEVVSTGNDIPLLDLAEVSDELNEAAADADLVLIEGMGRAVESNFDAEFTVDCLKLAMLKDAKVAERVGGELYDCVCKYAPVEAASPADQALGQREQSQDVDEV